jgi:CubicO group peptidase (beta-lactamase class C family)
VNATASVDAVVRAGCGVRYTAAVLRIERAGRAVFERAYGTLDDSEDAAPACVTSAFDLASLTKVFVATAALRAVAAGVLDLDAPLVSHVPEWRGREHAGITLRMLLAHTAGMQSGADYRTLLGASVERFALERELVARPGERVIYSDLGFIALGVILARATGRGLASVVRGALEALGCEGTAYRPRGPAARAVPATEEDAWRGRVRGYVHDEKAYLMNGVAGHAGLFGTARDVAALARAFLGPTAGRDARALPVALAREALAEQGADPVLRRGLGWALKTSDTNSCGAVMSQETFGHTGFTGTCVWADPVRDLAVVLLTNAVYFGRHDLRDVRAAVCDAATLEYA